MSSEVSKGDFSFGFSGSAAFGVKTNPRAVAIASEK